MIATRVPSDGVSADTSVSAPPRSIHTDATRRTRRARPIPATVDGISWFRRYGTHATYRAGRRMWGRVGRGSGPAQRVVPCRERYGRSVGRERGLR